ncbi:uncharacterized protein LOC116172335 [Photinus pyralis]|uniref:uncharacterized protein LOC116172335 n=1 Tax=Photinus pyralis TaxID=7054 RepID=UPI0012676C05|nr:uncharacterized protein LOC116172335 [Photinus pyralis]
MKCVLVALFVFFAVASCQFIFPHHYGYVHPYAYGGLYRSAHVVAAVPAVQNGYVAATRGAVHTAPLPEGPHAFSHHINTAPAPGTL